MHLPLCAGQACPQNCTSGSWYWLRQPQVALAAGVVAGLGHRAGLSGLYRRKPDDRPLADPS